MCSMKFFRARWTVHSQTASNSMVGFSLERCKIGALWEKRIRTFRQNTARQEANSLKEREMLLENNVKKEFLNSSQKVTLAASPNLGNKKDNSATQLSPSWLSWLFVVYLYFAIFVVKPKIDFLSGVPWWSVPPDIVAVWILYNLTLSSSEKDQLKEEYVSYSLDHPHTSFIDFLNDKHPCLFDGIDVQQREIIAALGACYAFTGDTAFIQGLQKQRKSAQNRQNRIENIMNHLVSTYPKVFSN